MFADDFSYSFSFSNGERIESITDIFFSQVAHYNVMNGRIITHFLAQLFLYFGDGIFNYINVCFYLLLIFLIYLHVYSTLKNFSLLNFLLISVLLFLCTPSFGQSFLWITGASNYLYGIIIILLVLLPYRLQINNYMKI